MAAEGLTRRLSAILNIDAVGYSCLMGNDEATVKRVTVYLHV